MFQPFFNLFIRIVIAVLVAGVCGITCAQADASCGNYLHTRDGGPQKMFHNLQSEWHSHGWVADLRLRPSLVTPGDFGPQKFPGRPCTGPFCRQSPAGPGNATLVPIHWNFVLKFAAGLDCGIRPLQPVRSHRTAPTGPATLPAGFPPGIDIPPESVTG